MAEIDQLLFILVPPVPHIAPLKSHLARRTLFSRVPHVALVARPAETAPPFHLQIQITRTTQNSSHARKRYALFA